MSQLVLRTIQVTTQLSTRLPRGWGSSLFVDTSNNRLGIGVWPSSEVRSVKGYCDSTSGYKIRGVSVIDVSNNSVIVGKLSALDVSGNITGNIATASQPSITQVAELYSLDVSGCVTANSVVTVGNGNGEQSLLKFNMDRPWTFKSVGTGANNKLVLQ